MSEQIDESSMMMLWLLLVRMVQKVHMNQIPDVRKIDNHKKCGGKNNHWWLQQVHNVVVDYTWLKLSIEFKQFGAMHIFEKFQV